MTDELTQLIAAACQDVYGVEVQPMLSRPEEQFGDFSTNVALQLTNQLSKNPREIAEALSQKLQSDTAIAETTVAGPGFINLRLTDAALFKLAQSAPAKSHTGQETLIEYGDPNPFKAMHIGHLYSYIVGEATALLLEAAGAQVRRLSYHGDVGLHVAKTIWAMRQENIPAETLTDSAKNNIGLFYAKGAQAYEANPQAKGEIDEINAQIYDRNSDLQELYRTGREQSFADFDLILNELGIKNDKRYLESQSAPAGIQLVTDNIGKVFVKSDGATVYEGEKVGLHTRVFITSKGLPTYEAKDLGLTTLKDQDYPAAVRSIIVTAHEQAEYFKVMLAALAEINPAAAVKTEHIAHGFVSLASGKMSSRTGDIYSAASLLHDVQELAQKLFPGASAEVQLGAIKYAFLKNRLGGDIVYDPEESVSLEGNSGPYLQYAHARARSILQKAGDSTFKTDEAALEAGERALMRKIGEYAETVDKAANELMPHHICVYLYELAQVFNRFYEHNRVIDDPRQSLRLYLVQSYADTLRNGLKLLGIASPDKM